MNVVIYARYSSRSQTEQSIEGQLQTCYEFAKNNGHTIDDILLDEIEEHFENAVSSHARCSPLVADAPPKEPNSLDAAG